MGLEFVEMKEASVRRITKEGRKCTQHGRKEKVKI